MSHVRQSVKFTLNARFAIKTFHVRKTAKITLNARLSTKTFHVWKTVKTTAGPRYYVIRYYGHSI